MPLFRAALKVLQNFDEKISVRVSYYSRINYGDFITDLKRIYKLYTQIYINIWYMVMTICLYYLPWLAQDMPF